MPKSDIEGEDDASRSAPWIKDDYYLDDEEFAIEVFGMAEPIHLWDGPNLTYEDLLRENPHRAYVIAIEHFFSNLAERSKSLSVIDRMLGFQTFPIENAGSKISRYEWLRIVLDVMLSRFASIRDCAFILAAEVYELGLAPTQVNMRALSKQIQDKSMVDALRALSRAGRELREERDRHLHRGEERSLSKGSDQMFRLLSFYEPSWNPHITISSEDGTNKAVEPHDIPSMYSAAVEEIRASVDENAQELMQVVRKLLDLLLSEYQKRWEAKRDIATDVRRWE